MSLCLPVCMSFLGIWTIITWLIVLLRKIYRQPLSKPHIPQQGQVALPRMAARPKILALRPRPNIPDNRINFNRHKLESTDYILLLIGVRVNAYLYFYAVDSGIHNIHEPCRPAGPKPQVNVERPFKVTEGHLVWGQWKSSEGLHIVLQYIWPYL